MTEVSLKKARKLKSPIVVARRGTFEEVTEIKRWGKNWMVITTHGDFVAADTYQGLFRCTHKELACILGQEQLV